MRSVACRGGGEEAGRTPARLDAARPLARWKEGMVELLDQLELLDPLSSATAAEMTAQQDPAEKFQHLRRCIR